MIKRLSQRMTLGIFALASALAVSGCEAEPAGEPIVRTEIKAEGSESPSSDRNTGGRTGVESVCRSIIFEDLPFTLCTATPGRHSIRTVLAGSDGAPLRSFDALSKASTIDPQEVAFAMNAGMFEDDGTPTGYFVQRGNRIAELDRADGSGNFYLKPNGVFYGTGDTWEVRSTNDFLNNVLDRPEFGTQSGPMLVVDGVLHPAITQDGDSKLVRNAVGVDWKGRAQFVISNAPVSFGKVARLYRDKLEVKNALYLDGNVSALWNPAAGRMDSGTELGPMLLIEKLEEPGEGAEQ